MTDVAAGETLNELVSPVSEAAADVEATAPDAALPQSDTSAGQVAERALPFEIEHPIGAVRQGVLNHLLDSEGPQTVAQIIAGLGNYTRGTVESAIKREFDAGRIERVSPGVYRLAPPKPPGAPEPATPEPASSETTDEQWFARLEEWKAAGEWKGPGNPPNQAGHLVPMDAIVKYGERVRKRQERQRQREEADEKLRDQLLAETGGNYMCGARVDGLDDMTTIRLMLQVVPLQHILTALKRTVDRRIDPQAAPISSWKDERFLRHVARDYALEVLVPSMIAGWEAAGRAPKNAAAPENAPTAPPGKRQLISR
jgi:hypothetical protein